MKLMTLILFGLFAVANSGFAGTILVHGNTMYAIGSDTKIYSRQIRGGTEEDQKFKPLDVPFPDKVRAMDLLAIDMNGHLMVEDTVIYARGSDGKLYAYRFPSRDGKPAAFELSNFQLPEGVSVAGPRLGRSRR